jgi:hypothetical protein
MNVNQFKRIIFNEILPGGIKPDATIIFYKKDNYLGK